MYSKILVALENSRADESLVPHVIELAKRLHSRLLLVHVADGWVARNFDRLKLAESQEIIGDHISRIVQWKSGAGVASLAGKPVRLRFIMKDADLYSIRFRN